MPVLVSRTLDLIRTLRPHSAKQDDFLMSPPSSPRSSSESEYILPISAGPTKQSFDDLPTSSHLPLLFVLILFPLSTAVTLYSLSTLPISSTWPHNLAELSMLGRELNMYAMSGPQETAHIVAVMSIAVVWKHAWSIPGSVLWNVLAGALFHPFLATVLLTALTSIGSVFSTLLATPLTPLLSRFFPKPLQLTRTALEGSDNSSPPWVRLSVLRLIGLVPWSGINIASGIAGVALRDCALGAFIGSLPWTAVTCQIGDILQTLGVNAMDQGQTISSLLASPQIVIELVFLSFLSLAPILAREQLSRIISSPSLPTDITLSPLSPEGEKVVQEKGKPACPSRHKRQISVVNAITSIRLVLTRRTTVNDTHAVLH